MAQMSEELYARLNEQMNVERKNEIAYKQFAMILDNANWPGTVKWMNDASDEERGHYNKFAEWIITNGYAPYMDSVPAALPSDSMPTGENLIGFYEGALEIEKANTVRLLALYEFADEMDEYDTCSFLQEFLIDQRKGENEIADILLSLKRMSKGEMVLWDAQLGK